MIKGLIFDLDGTLIDSIADIHYSVNLALKKHGYPEQPYEFVKLNTGRGFKRLIQDCLPYVEDLEIEKVLKSYVKFYGEHYNKRTKAYDGINDTLLALEEAGIKLAVNSNKKDEYTKQLMKTIFPQINFVAVFGERENIKNKPDPTTANEIVDMMGLNKNEVLYVGDSEVDIRTAKNAKLDSIGCEYGFRGKDILIKEGATYFIKKPSEILDIVIKEKKENA